MGTLLIIAIVVTVLYAISALLKKDKKKTVTKEVLSSSSQKRLRYPNGDSVSLYDVWKGDIKEGSVFSPANRSWYFDVSGLNSNGKLIFSSGWHNNMVLKEQIPKFEDIKRWQITLATDLDSNAPPDAYKNLKWE